MKRDQHGMVRFSYKGAEFILTDEGLTFTGGPKLVLDDDFRTKLREAVVALYPPIGESNETG